MTTPIRIVVVGNSHARDVQLPALDYLGGNEVVGIAGSDPDKAARTAERWGIPHSTSDWRQLLGLDPDLVIIATPVDLHHEMVRAALETEAAVLCEKPFALTVEQAEELAEAGRDRLALIDFQMRWNPLRRQMRSRCRDGSIGEPLHVRADLVLDTADFWDRPFTWWSQASRGGGVMGATGVHLIDNIQWMLGPIEAVSARLETFVTRRADADGASREVTSEDYAELRLELDGGVRASLTVSLALRGVSRWLFEIAGREGSLRLDRELELVGGAHGHSREPIAGDTDWYPPEQYGIQGKGPFAALEARFLGSVLEAVQEGRRELPQAATFADGVRNVRVLEAARESARSASGAWVRCR